MNPYDGVKFGRIGYTGILRSDLTSIWNDAPVLFRKLYSVRSILAAKALSKKLFVSFTHCFTYNHIKYCAVFTPMYDMNYICRIYPEDFFLKNAFSEMYDYIHSIKKKAASALIDTKEYFEKNCGRFGDSGFDGFMESQIRLFEDIFSDSGNVLKMFDKSHMCEYVPICSYLEHTYNHIKKYNSDQKKNVLFDIDIAFPVARMNYTVLESAIFLMVRICYMVMAENDSVTIKIKGREDGSLSFDMSYDIRVGFDEYGINKALRLLRCDLSEIGGELRFYISGDKIEMSCYVPASLSNYVSRIRKIDRKDDLSNEVYELRGIEDVFYSYEKNFIAFRSYRKDINIDISAMLSELILSDTVA